MRLSFSPHTRASLIAPAANENTNTRVAWFSMLEAILMLSLGLWQLLYLRSFFERKRSF